MIKLHAQKPGPNHPNQAGFNKDGTSRRHVNDPTGNYYPFAYSSLAIEWRPAFISFFELEKLLSGRKNAGLVI